MPISKEDFKKIIAKNSKTFAEEASTYSPSRDYYSNSNMMENTRPELDYTPLPGDDDSYMDDSYYDSVPMAGEPVINQAAFMASKMPEAIKQSMMTERIDVSSANPNRSVVDEIYGAGELPTRKRRAPEMQTPVQKYSQPSQGIDYSIIKAIVNECLNEKLSAIKQEILSEGSLKKIGLSGGKITLTDNKGNTYGASLKKLD